MTNTQNALAVLVIIAGITGCQKPAADSSLRTLDNIASATPNYEACEGTGRVHAKAALDSYPHLKKALSAVPMSIQNGFFDDHGGRIRLVTTMTSSDCPSSYGHEDDTLSCWKRLPNPAQSLEIIIRKSTPAKEQYALVRAFGYIYGDILMNRILPANADLPVTLDSRPDGSLRNFKAHLASIFLGELARITPVGQRSKTGETLEGFGIPNDVFLDTNFETRWLKFTHLPETTQDGFASRVFAEAFHSQFCTAKSAARACDLFGETMKSFEPYAKDAASGDTRKPASCSKKSMSLTKQENASSTRSDWFAANASSLASRRAAGAETGALVSSRIAQAMGSGKSSFNLDESSNELKLAGDMLGQLTQLFSGGSCQNSTAGGFDGFLKQIFSGGGANLLSSNGLGDIMSSLGLGLGDNKTTPTTPTIPTTPPNSKNPSNQTQKNTGGIGSTQEQKAIDATNTYRQGKGLSALQVDQTLIEDCRKQSQKQAEINGLEHFLYPRGTATGENIAYGYTDGESTVQQWITSPPHHANIVGNYTYFGIGNVGNQWCQRFR